jgi:hypothetical protein
MVGADRDRAAAGGDDGADHGASGQGAGDIGDAGFVIPGAARIMGPGQDAAAGIGRFQHRDGRVRGADGGEGFQQQALRRLRIGIGEGLDDIGTGRHAGGIGVHPLPDVVQDPIGAAGGGGQIRLLPLELGAGRGPEAGARAEQDGGGGRDDRQQDQPCPQASPIRPHDRRHVRSAFITIAEGSMRGLTKG